MTVSDWALFAVISFVWMVVVYLLNKIDDLTKRISFLEDVRKNEN